MVVGTTNDEPAHETLDAARRHTAHTNCIKRIGPQERSTAEDLARNFGHIEEGTPALDFLAADLGLLGTASA